MIKSGESLLVVFGCLAAILYAPCEAQTSRRLIGQTRIISVYKYAGARYLNSRSDFEVSADRKDFPKSTEKARSTCEHVNTSTEKTKFDGRRSGWHE